MKNEPYKENSLINYKIEIMNKDIDAAFASFVHSGSKINLLRGWSMTVTLAYTSYLISVHTIDFSLYIPYAIFWGLFIYMDAIERDLAHEATDDLRMIKEIFNETEPNHFYQKIWNYQFRETRNANRPTFNCQRFGRRLKLMFCPAAFVWYILQILLVSCYICCRM